MWKTNILLLLSDTRRNIAKIPGRIRRVNRSSHSSSPGSFSRYGALESQNCGSDRSYEFRVLKSQKIRFRVKAANDASICLTTGVGETPGSIYEIFIGGWGGKESAIRMNKTEDLCKVETPGILSQHEYRGFWVTVSRNGIKVGREDEASPFMSCSLMGQFLPPTHYGFCTAWGSTGSWTFSDADPTYFGPELEWNDKVRESRNCGTKRSYELRVLKSQKTRFRVKAANDASICLTSFPDKISSAMYEIFIGGWGGKESAIRMNKTEDLCKVETPGILSQHEFRGFWVTVSRNGIKVGREGECTPFMQYSDPSSNITATHYGFCTAWGAAGSWTFSDEDPTYFGQDLDTVPKAEWSVKPRPEFHDGDIPEDAPPHYTAEAAPPRYPGVMLPPSYAEHQLSATSSRSNQSLTWVKCSNGSVCDAPVAVEPGAASLLVASAYHMEALTPGAFHPTDKMVLVPWGYKAHVKSEYYMLSNPGELDLKWVSASMGMVPNGAVQGGISEHGEGLFVCRVKQDGVYFPGKVHPRQGGCYVTKGTAEQSYFHYQVLCLKNVPMTLLGMKWSS